MTARNTAAWVPAAATAGAPHRMFPRNPTKNMPDEAILKASLMSVRASGLSNWPPTISAPKPPMPKPTSAVKPSGLRRLWYVVPVSVRFAP